MSTGEDHPEDPSGGDSASPDGSPDGGGPDDPPEPPEIEDLLEELEDLETTVDTRRERRQVREAIRLARRMNTRGAFGRVVYGFDRSDLAEALLGSLLFGIPMFVEGGTLEVGAFVATHPLYLAGTLALSVAMVVGILFVADIQDVRIHRPLFGVLPRKLLGVVTVAFVTALAMMTAWGRVDWADPRLALAQVAVAFLPMAIGAALGDILPGD